MSAGGPKLADMNSTTLTTTCTRLLAALTLAGALAVAAPAAEAAPKPPGIDRVAKAPGTAKKKIKLTKREAAGLQRKLLGRTGRAYGEFLGPYCTLFTSTAVFTCQWQETFGMWRTWTYSWRNYGNGWVGQGWSVY